MSTSTTSSHAQFGPADFALVTTREPDFAIQRNTHLMIGAKDGTIKGLTDESSPNSGYSLLMNARSGVYGPGQNSIMGGGSTVVPTGAYLISSTAPYAGGIRQVKDAVTALSAGAMAGLDSADGYYVLRMLPCPNEGPEESMRGENQVTGALLAPRPHSLARGSVSNSLSISNWGVDNIFSAKGTLSPPGGAWLEGYIAAWQSLAQNHPILGRRPYLALKFGQRWWGIGETALILDSIEVKRDYYEKGVLAHATLNLSFQEILI